jgi:hypothetical protein
MAKGDTRSKYFSSASTSSKRKADNISSVESTPLRHSTRVKKTVIPKDVFQDSGEESDKDGTNYNEDTEAEEEEEGDVDDDDDSDSRNSVTIEIPKARTAGARPYENDQIHQNTFLFLADLKKNNNRDWLKCLCPLLTGTTC